MAGPTPHPRPTLSLPPHLPLRAKTSPCIFLKSLVGGLAGSRDSDIEAREVRQAQPPTSFQEVGEVAVSCVIPGPRHLGFGHKPRGEGRPRSFHSSVLTTNRGGEERPRSFHSSVLARKPRGEGRPRSFHSSVLATNREVKEGRAPFTLRF